MRIVNKLGRFLTKELSDYGKQVHFARETKFSPGTVTKWVKGENVPNFENCLIIADYFDLDPGRVFKMAGKLDYFRLYQRLLKRAQYQVELCERFQKLIDEGMEKDLETILSSLESQLTDSEIDEDSGPN